MTYQQSGRRTVLRTASGIALASNGGRGIKAPKDAVNYQDHPNEMDQYAGCHLLIPSKESENAGKYSVVEGKNRPRRVMPGLRSKMTLEAPAPEEDERTPLLQNRLSGSDLSGVGYKYSKWESYAL